MNPTLTAAEFAAQGTTPGVILSIARFNHNYGLLFDSPDNVALAVALRRIAAEVGRLTGMPLPKRGKRAGNDNDNRKAGKVGKQGNDNAKHFVKAGKRRAS